MAQIRFFILVANKLKPRCKRLLFRVALAGADWVSRQACSRELHYSSRTSCLRRVRECYGAAAGGPEGHKDRIRDKISWIRIRLDKIELVT